MGGEASVRIGAKLRKALISQGHDIEWLVEQTGKKRDHLEAVLDGFPNTTQRPTELDTVDDIAGKLGLRLDITGDLVNAPGVEGSSDFLAT